VYIVDRKVGLDSDLLGGGALLKFLLL
jgi:hypothetical protein